MTPAQILKDVKTVARDHYAWPGGYEMFAITSDGGALCFKCCRAEFPLIARATIAGDRSGWRCEGIDATCNCDTDPVYCDHCGRVIYEWEE